MDQQGHDYAAAANAMAYGQQQQPATNMQSQQQQQQFGYHPQQYPPSHFMPPHPSMPQMPYPHHMQQRPQLHPHPPPPHLRHLPPQQSPPPFTPHLPPHHLVPPPFQGTYDSAPAPPPSDPDLQKRIDKLVEYVKKNGPEFEIMVREKEQANPAYSFLFGGEGHNYYRYKLFVSSHPPSGPFNPPFPPSSMPAMHPPPHPMMNPAASGSMLGTSQMHQPPFPSFYDPHLHHHPPPFGSHGPSDFDQSSKAFKGPLPPEIAMDLNNMLNSLNGTKESIKGAKAWFMQRSTFAPALAEALRDRVFALDDSERQLHIIYLANDILFDSIQRRASPRDLDNEALAFRPVLGSMLARIYHNPQNKDEVQSRLQKILQFWASKEVYDQDTVNSLEGEMLSGPSTSSFPGPSKESFVPPADPSVVAGFPQQIANSNVPQWQPDRQGLPGQEHPDKQVLPVMQSNQQFLPSSVAPGPVLGSIPVSSSVQPPYPQPPPQAPQANVGEKLPPYPLFPPGLIPGMVRKMQIGSGVPYSPLSPLDIPTIIPPSTVSPQEILERVSKFFKEIGEVNPSEGPMGSHSDDDDEYMKGGQSPVRKGGACIPPPPNLQVDPDTGAYADGSVDVKGSGRLGLGATADPNEPSQYDDVYTSYRKQRSTTYHSSMSAKAVTR